MKLAKWIVGSALVGAALVLLMGTGLWLLSLTTYPFWPTVGGATLIAAGFGALVGLICGVDG